MGPSAGAIVGLVALGVWCVGVNLKFDEPLVRWFIQRSRNVPKRMVKIVFASHLAWVVLWVLVAIASNAISDEAGSRAAAGWLVVPVEALYGPFVLTFMPSQMTGFRESRAEAERWGANVAAARAMFWTGGFFGIFGLSITIVSFFACFFP